MSSDDDKIAKDEPPPGPPWDLRIGESPLAFVDLEMTGLDRATDRVIEVAIVRKRGGRIDDSLDTLVDPGQNATFGTDVHGLSPASVVGAPSFGDIAGRIETLCDGAIIVAHAAFWDVAFLEAEFGRSGRPLRFPYYLDTLTLARRALLSESHSLDAISRKLGIPRGRAHRAGDDVRVLCALFDRLVADLSPQTPRDLWHVRTAERHARPEIVERSLALAQSGEPAWITYRPSHKAPRSFEAIVRQVRTDLDPPRLLGYSLPGRGRFELRADRVLSIVLSSEKAGPSKS